jgi:hypothetical protein
MKKVIIEDHSSRSQREIELPEFSDYLTAQGKLKGNYIPSPDNQVGTTYVGKGSGVLVDTPPEVNMRYYYFVGTTDINGRVETPYLRLLYGCPQLLFTARLMPAPTQYLSSMWRLQLPKLRKL